MTLPTVTTARLTQAILNWWRDAQYLTAGLEYDQNVFDDAPDFVDMALHGATEDQAPELALRIQAWWLEARSLTAGPRGERNVFDDAPEFVTLANQVRQR